MCLILLQPLKFYLNFRLKSGEVVIGESPMRGSLKGDYGKVDESMLKRFMITNIMRPYLQLSISPYSLDAIEEIGKI